MLASTECYQRIKSVDISPVLAALPEFRFIDTGHKCAWVTDHNSVAPVPLQAFVDSLELGGKQGRLFCRKLMPGQHIAPHVDAWIPEDQPWRRFHVPLVTHPDVIMRWPDDGMELHLEIGYLYEVRFNRTHEVVNPSDSERVHIQIDQLGATI